MSNPIIDLLGTKTAHVPTLEDASKSFFSKYHPQNDTFDHETNTLAVGIRPSWVLQARELTELQTLLKNQLRLIVEGDEVVLSTPEDIADGGGLRSGWFNKDKLPLTYETTANPESIPQEAVDKYNDIYGTIQFNSSQTLPPGTHVGHWLKDGNSLEVEGGFKKENFVNFRDFKRITLGTGDFYVHPQDGIQSYFLKNEEVRHVDFYGWHASDWGYAWGSNIYDEDGQEGAPNPDPANDVFWSPNEWNANGSGATAHTISTEGINYREYAREILGVQPDVTYIMGLSIHESVVKPGGTASNDRYLLDNAAGYNNHEAPGAYRIKFVVDSIDYVPVFTGELTPYAIPFWLSLENFPWNEEPCPIGIPNVLGQDTFGTWDDFQEFVNLMLEDFLTSFPDDHPLYANRIYRSVGLEKVITALTDGLGYEIKASDENAADEDKRIVLYRYPTVEEYFHIFNKYGIRRTFVDTENILDDREKNRLKLNHNSVVWDYRFVDPEYLKGYIPTGGMIGNGLIDTYGSYAFTHPELQFALGINYATNEFEALGGDIGGYSFEYYQNSKIDPLLVPYVPALYIGWVSPNHISFTEEPYFKIDRLQQTAAQIKSLSYDALTTSSNTNFIPILHVTNNIFAEIGGDSYIGGSEDGNVFDPREYRFIMPPSPTWDWNTTDVFQGSVTTSRAFYSYHGVTLPFGNSEGQLNAYFNHEGTYSWQ